MVSSTIITIALHSSLNISETVRDRGLVPKGAVCWYIVHQSWCNSPHTQ